MKYELVMFDLDGTIADTSEGIFGGIKFVQDQMHLPPLTIEQMRTHIGPSPRESFSRNFNLQGERLDTALALYKKYADTSAYKQAKIYTGIVPLLTEIYDCEVKCAITTLKLEETAVRMMDHLNLSAKFNVIKGAYSHLHLSKKDIVIDCMSELDVLPEKAVLIGDSEYDAIGAQEAGIDFIGVTYGFGFGKKFDVEHFNPVFVGDSVDEVHKFLFG